jgi:Flp pilus assembly protein TadG
VVSTQDTQRHVCSLRLRWRQLAAQPDRGAATIELVLAVPVLLLMLMLVVQAGVWWHATHIAQAAATAALDAARAEGGSTADGQAAGATTLRALAGGALQRPRVEVTRTATRTSVRVSAVAEAVIPGVRWTVQATATGPTEHFVPDLPAGR